MSANPVAKISLEDQMEDNSADYEDIDAELPMQGSWIQWFCSIEGNEFLIEVEEEYIKNKFNLFNIGKGLTPQKINEVLSLILSPYIPNEQEMHENAFMQLNQLACDIYGQIHCRYILTPRGLIKKGYH